MKKHPFPMPCLLHKIQVHGKSYRGRKAVARTPKAIIDLAERQISGTSAWQHDI